MKKSLSVLAALLLALLPSLALATSADSMLGGDPAPTQSEWDGVYAGHWEAVGMSMNDQPAMTLCIGMPTAAVAQLDLNEDGTFRLFLMTNVTTGQWTNTETAVTLTGETETLTAELKDGQLRLMIDGVLLCLAKGAFAVSNVAPESPWDGSLLGTWGCIGVDMGTGVYLDSLMGVPASSIMTLTLEEDGTLTGVSQINADAEPAKGTWEGTADALTLTMSSPLEARIENGQLRFVLNGMNLTLAQQP